MFQQLFDMSENFAVKKMNHTDLCISILFYFDIFNNKKKRKCVKNRKISALFKENKFLKTAQKIFKTPNKYIFKNA